MSTARRRVRVPETPVEPTTAVAVVGGLLLVELVALAAYLGATGTGLLAPRFTLYPLLWVNVAAWVLLRRPTVAASPRRRIAAGAAGVGYFLVLAVAGGVVRASGMAMPLEVTWLSPGWGPLVTYAGGWVQLTVVPFEVVGYAALAVLVYTLLLAGSRHALAGAAGVATCVGCVWPLGAAALAAVGGVGSPLATAVPGFAYDLSTALFLFTAGVLHWAVPRPE